MELRHHRPDRAFTEAFQRWGVAVVVGAWQGDDLAAIHTTTRHLRARVEARPVPGVRLWRAGRSCGGIEHHDPQTVRDFGWGVNEITRRELFDAQVVNALAAPSMVAASEALLDQPRAWGMKVLWAPRTSHYDLGWHRDCGGHLEPLLPYKPAANDHIQINGALEPDDAFIVVPGSHRRSLHDHELAAIMADRRAELDGARRIALEPGDALFMDAHALHRGEAQPGAPRLTLHLSCQSQWVPLLPWEDPDTHAWHRSPEFLHALDPAIRPWFERLRSATTTDDRDRWLTDHARAQGWDGIRGIDWRRHEP